jgi:hypothetical protein
MGLCEDVTEDVSIVVEETEFTNDELSGGSVKKGCFNAP